MAIAVVGATWTIVCTVELDVVLFACWLPLLQPQLPVLTFDAFPPVPVVAFWLALCEPDDPATAEEEPVPELPLVLVDGVDLVPDVFVVAVVVLGVDAVVEAAGVALCTALVGVAVGVLVAPDPLAKATPANKNARASPAEAPKTRTSCLGDSFAVDLMVSFLITSLLTCLPQGWHMFMAVPPISGQGEIRSPRPAEASRAPRRRVL